jgi:hypothetical protein
LRKDKYRRKLSVHPAVLLATVSFTWMARIATTSRLIRTEFGQSLAIERRRNTDKTQKPINKHVGVGSWIFLYVFLMLFTLEKLRDKSI